MPESVAFCCKKCIKFSCDRGWKCAFLLTLLTIYNSALILVVVICVSCIICVSWRACSPLHKPFPPKASDQNFETYILFKIDHRSKLWLRGWQNPPQTLGAVGGLVNLKYYVHLGYQQSASSLIRVIKLELGILILTPWKNWKNIHYIIQNPNIGQQKRTEVNQIKLSKKEIFQREVKSDVKIKTSRYKFLL